MSPAALEVVVGSSGEYGNRGKPGTPTSGQAARASEFRAVGKRPAILETTFTTVHRSIVVSCSGARIPAPKPWSELTAPPRKNLGKNHHRHCLSLLNSHGFKALFNHTRVDGTSASHLSYLIRRLDLRPKYQLNGIRMHPQGRIQCASNLGR